MTRVVIHSPLAPGAFAKHCKSLPIAGVVDGYQSLYGIDVSAYFTGLDCIEIYECQRTGYRFYYPFSLVGQESLYRHLEQSDWCYKGDKWEYQRALDHIAPGSLVLDVGCGRGAFVGIAKYRSHSARGLELNTSAASDAKAAGLDVIVETIGDHCAKHCNVYDTVCSFQVLEHIPQVNQFISDCVSVLKPGGRLIFGVPNNGGFLRLERQPVLNAPPHHMGLWTKRSLSALPSIFPIRLQAIECEPLAEIDWYSSVIEDHYLPRFIRPGYYKLGFSSAFKAVVRRRAKAILGHTILAVFEKL